MVESDKTKKISASIIGEMRKRIDSGDSPAAVSACLKAVAAKSITIKDLYLNVLTPALAGLGEEWQQGKLPVWREHLASAICRDIMGAMAPEIKKNASAANGKSVVLACPQDELHDLGLRMYADLYRLAGWRVFFLGADVPSSEIMAAAMSIKPNTVVLTAATHYGLIYINAVVEEMVAAMPSTEIFLSGPAYKDRVAALPNTKILNPMEIA